MSVYETSASSSSPRRCSSDTPQLVTSKASNAP
ncbi:hypothetical protein ABIB86_007822, partial [Bradyrhizobium sp. JR1.7]